jgi:hypothetical protein
MQPLDVVDPANGRVRRSVAASLHATGHDRPAC